MILPYITTLPKLTVNRYYDVMFEFNFDLTGYDYRMQIRVKEDVNSTLIVEPTLTLISATETESELLCEVTPEQTSELTLNNNSVFYYDLVLSKNNKPQTYVKGDITFIYNVSENPINE